MDAQQKRKGAQSRSVGKAFKGHGETYREIRVGSGTQRTSGKRALRQARRGGRGPARADSGYQKLIMSFQLRIETIPIKPDNYSYLITSGDSAVLVDASDAAPVLDFLQTRNVKLSAVLSTHHHSDHTLGNEELKDKTGCSIFAMDSRVRGVDRIVNDGENFSLNGIELKAIHVPGHTRHQASFYLESAKSLFTGDTLFGAGCGRVFEGGPDQMYNSLEKCASFPDETKVYFGHEYTLENLQFALTVEPDNKDIVARMEMVRKAVSAGGYSTPSTVLEEKRTNPFLRCREKSIRKYLGMVDRSPVAVFTELRRRKDVF